MVAKKETSFPNAQGIFGMGYQTLAGTEEDLIRKTIRELSPAEIKEATGKTPDHFYKVANPNNNLGLHLLDAIALDQAWYKKNGTTPFFNFYSTALDATDKRGAAEKRPTHALGLGQGLGDLCRVTVEHDADGVLDDDELNTEIRVALRLQSEAQKIVANLEGIKKDRQARQVKRAG